jgi:hypothetical protein
MLLNKHKIASALPEPLLSMMVTPKCVGPCLMITDAVQLVKVSIMLPLVGNQKWELVSVLAYSADFGFHPVRTSAVRNPINSAVVESQTFF